MYSKLNFLRMIGYSVVWAVFSIVLAFFLNSLTDMSGNYLSILLMYTIALPVQITNSLIFDFKLLNVNYLIPLSFFFSLAILFLVWCVRPHLFNPIVKKDVAPLSTNRNTFSHIILKVSLALIWSVISYLGVFLIALGGGFGYFIILFLLPFLPVLLLGSILGGFSYIIVPIFAYLIIEFIDSAIYYYRNPTSKRNVSVIEWIVYFVRYIIYFVKNIFS